MIDEVIEVDPKTVNELKPLCALVEADNGKIIQCDRARDVETRKYSYSAKIRLAAGELFDIKLKRTDLRWVDKRYRDAKDKVIKQAATNSMA